MRDAIHHRAKHGLQANFVCERTAKFNQRAAVVEAIAIEESVQPRLDAFAERLKEECGNHDGNHAAYGAGGLFVENLRDQRHQSEINRCHRGGRRRIRQAALENNVHIHQPIANDGVAKAQGDQHQAEGGKLHPRQGCGVKNVGNDVQQGEWQASRQRSASQPFQLLPQYAGARAPVTEIENQSGSQEVKTKEAEFQLIQFHSRAGGWDKTTGIQRHQNVNRKQRQRRQINPRELRQGFSGSFRSFWKDQRKMQQQRRSEQTCYDARPIDFQIEGVQLAAKVERTNNKGNQAKNIKMHGARSVPPPRKDEQANEEIQKSDNAQIIFNGDWLVRWGGDQPGFKFLAIAGELVAKLGPKPGPVQAVCHHCRPGHCNVVDRQQDVARMYSSGGGG